MGGGKFRMPKYSELPAEAEGSVTNASNTAPTRKCERLGKGTKNWRVCLSRNSYMFFWAVPSWAAPADQ